MPGGRALVKGFVYRRWLRSPRASVKVCAALSRTNLHRKGGSSTCEHFRGSSPRKTSQRCASQAGEDPGGREGELMEPNPGGVVEGGHHGRGVGDERHLSHSAHPPRAQRVGVLEQDGANLSGDVVY